MPFFTQKSLLFRLLRWLKRSGGEDSGQSWLDEITVERRGETTALPTDDIHLFEAYGDDVSISAVSGSYIKPGTISHFERNLDPAKFVRIHRSTIINMGKVVDVSPLIGGRLRIELSNHSTVTSSPDYQETILQTLPNLWPDVG